MRKRWARARGRPILKSSKNAPIMAKTLCGPQDALYTIAAHRKEWKSKQWRNDTISRLSFACLFTVFLKFAFDEKQKRKQPVHHKTGIFPQIHFACPLYNLQMHICYNRFFPLIIASFVRSENSAAFQTRFTPNRGTESIAKVNSDVSNAEQEGDGPADAIVCLPEKTGDTPGPEEKEREKNWRTGGGEY